ncbi:MAG: hypothetical protein Q4C04_08065 [Clostridia bacterium]|nr:hypothetical protein [Clostridia bacterium]
MERIEEIIKQIAATMDLSNITLSPKEQLQLKARAKEQAYSSDTVDLSSPEREDGPAPE